MIRKALLKDIDRLHEITDTFASSQIDKNSYQWNKIYPIRLETLSQNHRNQKFYELRGYKRLGNIYFPKQSEHPYYYYKLVL